MHLPDWESRIYQGVAGIVLFFIVFAVGGPRLNLPFFKRTDGGFFTYSKFAQGIENAGSIPSKLGMFVIYFPACLIGIYWFLSHSHTSRGHLCAMLMIIHFGKRSAETLFLHQYSGNMPLLTA